MTPLLDVEREIRHFHLFCGLGGGARGFNQGEARVGQRLARLQHPHGDLDGLDDVSTTPSENSLTTTSIQTSDVN